MKKLFILSFSVILLLTGKTFAVLAPIYQSTKEINSILIDKRLIDKLTPYDVIQNIIKTKNGYLVISNLHFVQIDMVKQMQPKGFAGPLKYALIFHDAITIDKLKK
jgi:hypothetical protein